MAEFFWKLLLCGLFGGTVWLIVSCLLERVQEELAPIRADLERIEKENRAEKGCENDRFKKLQARVAESENLISVLDSRLHQLEEMREAKAKTVSANAIQELVGRRS